MQMITGIQRRAPYAGSSNLFSDYNDYVKCEQFIVQSKRSDSGQEVELFFEMQTAPDQGVGLSLPPQSAIAVARALLMVAEGNAKEITVQLTD